MASSSLLSRIVVAIGAVLAASSAAAVGCSAVSHMTTSLLSKVAPFADGAATPFNRGQHSEQVVLMNIARVVRARLYLTRPVMAWQLFKKQRRALMLKKMLAAVVAVASLPVLPQLGAGWWWSLAHMLATMLLCHQVLSCHLRQVVLKTALAADGVAKLAHEASLNARLKFHPGIAAVFGLFDGHLVSEYVLRVRDYGSLRCRFHQFALFADFVPTAYLPFSCGNVYVTFAQSSSRLRPIRVPNFVPISFELRPNFVLVPRVA